MLKNIFKGINNVSVIRRFYSIDLKKRLLNKTAIITASTEGIGLAIAKRLGYEGASVIINSRKKENVEKSLNQLKSKGIDAHGIVCHIGKDQDRKNLIDFTLEKKGAIDILVSNAATNPTMGALLETSSEVWDKIFDVNVKSAFEISKLVVPHIKKRSGGSLVFISSIGGYQPLPLIGAYSISKTALLGLSKTLAVELASSNIRVNTVSPGLINTKFSKAMVESEIINNLIPLGRAGHVDEVSGVVAFLVSDDASYITGESIVPSGGFFSRL